MAFPFDYRNNVIVTLNAAVAAWITSISITPAQAALIPNWVQNTIATLEEIDLSTWAITLREGILITNRAANVLTVVRAYQEMPADDTAVTHTQISYAFDPVNNARIGLYWTREHTEELNDQIVAGAPSNLVHKTTAETINDLKTFTTLPQQDTYVAPTIDEELVPKKYVDDQLIIFSSPEIIFWDGSDGALVVAAWTTSLNYNQVYNFSSIDVSAWATVDGTGVGNKLLIKCNGTCNNDWLITAAWADFIWTYEGQLATITLNAWVVWLSGAGGPWGNGWSAPWAGGASSITGHGWWWGWGSAGYWAWWPWGAWGTPPWGWWGSWQGWFWPGIWAWWPWGISAWWWGWAWDNLWWSAFGWVGWAAYWNNGWDWFSISAPQPVVAAWWGWGWWGNRWNNGWVIEIHAVTRSGAWIIEATWTTGQVWGDGWAYYITTIAPVNSWGWGWGWGWWGWGWWIISLIWYTNTFGWIIDISAWVWGVWGVGAVWYLGWASNWQSGSTGATWVDGQSINLLLKDTI